MGLTPAMKIYNLPKDTYLKSKDINELRHFVGLFMDILVMVSYGFITYKEFLLIYNNCIGKDDKLIIEYVQNIANQVRKYNKIVNIKGL